MWLCWVFSAAPGLSLVARVRVTLELEYMGFSRWWLSLLQSAGSEVVACGLICCAAYGIFPMQGSNLLHWQEDSLPLDRQGSPRAHLHTSATCTHDGKEGSFHSAREGSTTAQSGAGGSENMTYWSPRQHQSIWRHLRMEVRVAAAATAVAAERTGAEDSSVQKRPRGPVV